MSVICLFTLCIATPAVAGECSLDGGEWARVGSVYDGDTLRIADGRKIRLVGVNTPELARPRLGSIKNGSIKKNSSLKQIDQPFAQEATRATRKFLASSARIRLVYGPDRHDRYRRTLAHVFNDSGDSLGEYLLERGLAFPIAIPPNVEMADCLFAVADKAREQQVGVWGEAEWRALSSAEVSADSLGFRRVSGRIESISRSKRGTWWLQLEGLVVLRLSAQDRAYFSEFDWSSLQGKRVEVSGWLTSRSNRAKARGYSPYLMSLRSPYAIRVIEATPSH